MAKLNTYGIKMAGIKAAAGLSRDLDIYINYRDHIKIYYNFSAGRVAAARFTAAGSWRVSPFPASFVEIWAIDRPATMADIAYYTMCGIVEYKANEITEILKERGATAETIAAARREIHAFARTRNIAPLVNRSAADLAAEIIEFYNMPWWEHDDNAAEYPTAGEETATCI
jgi:hypothetical protein